MTDAALCPPPPAAARLYGWKSADDAPIRDGFKRQKDFVMREFEDRSQQVFLQVRAAGLGCLLWSGCGQAVVRWHAVAAGNKDEGVSGCVSPAGDCLKVLQGCDVGH